MVKIVSRLPGGIAEEVTRQRKDDGDNDDDHRQQLDEERGVFDPHQNLVSDFAAGDKIE
jgi:hypothetical protein